MTSQMHTWWVYKFVSCVQQFPIVLKNCLLLVVIMTQVRSLIEDIRDVRFHKVETGLETISGRTHAVKVTFPASGFQELNQLTFLVPQILLKLLLWLDVICISIVSVFHTSLTVCFIAQAPTMPYASCFCFHSSKICLQWKWTLSGLSWWELCRHSISTIVHRWFSKQILQGAGQHQLQTVVQE